MQEQSYELVRIHDAAIDFQAMPEGQLVDYARTRDIAKLKLKPGKEPVRFYYRRLRARQLVDYVDRGTSEEDKFFRAFACGIYKVDGIRSHSWTPTGSEKPGYYAMAEDELALFEYADVLEMGSVIYARSRLPLDLGLDSPLPRSSVLALEARMRELPSAVLSEANAALNNSEPKEG